MKALPPRDARPDRKLCTRHRHGMEHGPRSRNRRGQRRAMDHLQRCSSRRPPGRRRQHGPGRARLQRRGRPPPSDAQSIVPRAARGMQGARPSTACAKASTADAANRDQAEAPGYWTSSGSRWPLPDCKRNGGGPREIACLDGGHRQRDAPRGLHQHDPAAAGNDERRGHWRRGGPGSRRSPAATVGRVSPSATSPAALPATSRAAASSSRGGDRAPGESGAARHGARPMIVRPRPHWLRLLFVWRGSVLPDILPQPAGDHGRSRSLVTVLHGRRVPVEDPAELRGRSR